MKNLSFSALSILLGLCVLFLAPGCGGIVEDDEPPTPTDNEIGGQYSEDLVLTNIHDEPEIVDYYVTESIWMGNDAGFIVEPGVRIEFAPGTNFQLGYYSEGLGDKGYIQAEGTAAQPIVFTGSETTKGIWNGIMIGCSSYDVRNILNHCIIEYAGGSSEQYAIKLPECSNGSQGLLSITNTTIRNTRGTGLYAEGDDCINQFSNNIFENNDDEAILMHAQDFTHIDGQTQFIANGTDGVVGIEGVFGGRIWNEEDHVWTKLSSGAYFINAKTYLTNGTLTIDPGVEIVMGNGRQLVLEGSSYITAIGTAEEPIIIRGENPGTPSWNAIHLFAHFTPNVLEHCHISEAGVGIIRNNTCHGQAAIGLDYWVGDGAQATIRNCQFSNSAGCGIYTVTENMGRLTQSGNTFTNMSTSDICN